MGAKSAGQGGMPMQQGDVPAFDMPPMQQPMQPQYTPQPQQPQYTLEEFSKRYGPNMTPDPNSIRRDPNQQAMTSAQIFDSLRGLQGMPPMPPSQYTPRGRDPNEPFVPLSETLGRYGLSFSGEPRSAPPMQPPMVTNHGPGSGLAPKAPTQMDDSEYLRMLYQQELGRAPDEQGMNFWQQQLGGGMNRDQLQRMFDQSEEGMGYNQRVQTAPTGMPGMNIDDFTPRSAPTLPASGGLGGGMPPEVADALRLAMARRTRPIY